MRLRGKGLQLPWLVILSLVTGSVVLSRLAAAQNGNGIHTDEGSHRSDKTNDFRFDVISIRPTKPEAANNRGMTADGYTAALPIYQMILFAYSPGDASSWSGGVARVRNGPPWINDWYQIDARVSNDDLKAWQDQGIHHVLLSKALQALLKERCNLVLHEQATKIPVYKLLVRGNKMKLQVSAHGAAGLSGTNLPSGGNRVFEGGPNWAPKFHFYGATMGDLAWYLNIVSDHPVRDMTGLTGRYDFPLSKVNQSSPDPGDRKIDDWPIDSLGLELKPGIGQGLDLIIDHVDKPSLN